MPLNKETKPVNFKITIYSFQLIVPLIIKKLYHKILPLTSETVFSFNIAGYIKGD